MQVEIVRHHRRSQNPDADVEHLLICYDVWSGDKSEKNTTQVRFGEKQLGRETRGDGRNEGDDQGFDITKALCLEEENGQDIECSDNASPHQGNAKKKLQGDGRADYFSQIAGGNCDLAKNP